MTITISLWMIPTILNIILIIWALWSAANDDGWFAGLSQLITGFVGTLIIWLAYCIYLLLCR